MPLDGAYCNALLLAHWSVHQKLNHVNSVFDSVTSLYVHLKKSTKKFLLHLN